MIFICPYKKTKNNEAEIMALSINKFCKVEHRIIFVGDNPGIKGTEHVNFVSKLRTKESRVAEQLLKAIDYIKNEPFILINDDIFALKPFDYIPLFCSGLITEQLKRYTQGNVYQFTLKNSIVQMDDLNFALHYPMPINEVNLFIAALKKTIELKSCSFRNLYGNQLIRLKKNADIRKTGDCKLFTRGTTAAFDKVLTYSDWLSVGDNWFTPINKKYVLTHIMK